MEDEKPIWVSTNYSDESDIKVGPFVGLEVYVFGASIVIGLVLTYLLVKKLSWPLVTSSLVGVVLPVIVTTALLKLVVNKPRGYWIDWCEHHVLRLFNAPLVKLKKPKGGVK